MYRCLSCQTTRTGYIRTRLITSTDWLLNEMSSIQYSFQNSFSRFLIVSSLAAKNKKEPFSREREREIDRNTICIGEEEEKKSAPHLA